MSSSSSQFVDQTWRATAHVQTNVANAGCVLGGRFQKYTDPQDMKTYIWDEQEKTWIKSEIALDLFDALWNREAPSKPPVKPHIPPPPNDPLPPFCQRQGLHAKLMHNGMPWENAQKIGRILTVDNWLDMNVQNVETFSESLRKRLFENHLPGVNQPGNELPQAIMRGVGHMQWAMMATHKGRYIGYAAKCPCGAMMRIAWNPTFTSRNEMEVQRKTLMQWLQLQWHSSGEDEPEPPLDIV